MVYQKFLEQTIGMLIESYPFFGCLVQKCAINWTFAMPTAAVRVLPNGNLEMVINPEFFCQLTPEERVGLVLHEMYHLTCDHLSRSFGLDPQIANVAMDTAINQHIPMNYLPPGALLPENAVILENRYRKANGEKEIKLDPMQAFEIYYNILKTEFDRQTIEKMQNPHKFEGQLDADNQQKLTPEQQKQQQEQMKNMLEEMLNQEKEMEKLKADLLNNLNNLSDDEKNSLKEIEKMQDELTQSQKELSGLFEKSKMQDLKKLNDDITTELESVNQKIKG